jgi:hypothetical protein
LFFAVANAGPARTAGSGAPAAAAGTPPVGAVSPTLGAWNAILGVEVDVPRECGPPRVLPSAVDPMRDRAAAEARVATALATDEFRDWPIVPGFEGVDGQPLDEPARPEGIRITIRSTVQGRNWIRLENTVPVSVGVQRSLPEHVNIVTIFHQCGGAGTIRTFEPVVELHSRSNSYQLTTRNTDAPFFTLQPGEFEVFLFQFRCEGSGLYSTTLRLPYRYPDNNGDITLGVGRMPRFGCPQRVTHWSFYHDLMTELTGLAGLERDGDFALQQRAYRRA